MKKVRIDYVTMMKEPQPPFWRMKLPATVFSFSIVILLVTLAIAAVMGVVFYRMSILAVLSVTDFWKLQTSQTFLFTTVTAACINLCLIVIFNWVRLKRMTLRIDCVFPIPKNLLTDLHVDS